MNFPEYKHIDYGQVADEILQFWKDNDIFEESISIREGQPSFTFYEGPPSANGTPGIHHVMARTIKDIFCRYQTLKGKQVNRKGGWDTHGLPVELQVEKELGITKDDIGKRISVEEYNQRCRETVMRFTDQWQEVTEKMGYWVDMESPYITYKNEYIESVWAILKNLYNKNLLYKGYTIQPYSPAAGTGLSSHELNMPGTYQDVRDTSIVAMFKVKDVSKIREVNAMMPVVFEYDFLPVSEDLKTTRLGVRNWAMEELRDKVYTNKNTGFEVGVSRSGIREYLSFSPTLADILITAGIPSLIENAICLATQKSRRGDGAVFHYLVAKTSLAKEEFWAKIVIKQKGTSYWLYDLGLSGIKKSLVEGVTRLTESDDTLDQRHDKDKRLLELIQIHNEYFYESLSKSVSQIHVLAWTTTPWTLPSNSALTIGEKIEYVAVKTFNPYTHEPCTVILAKALVGKYFNEKAKDIAFDVYKAGDKLIPFEIINTFLGKDLVGLRYEPLMPAVMNDDLQQNAFRIIAGDFVTTEDGTGVVHTSPTFGADDFRVAQQNGVPPVMIKDEYNKPTPIVDRKGKFVAEVGQYLVEKVAEHGIKTHRVLEKDDFYVKNYLSEDEKQTDYKTTDEIISIILKLENKAFDVKKYEHTYPHCWRTDKPILYYPLDSWFIKTTAVKDRMIALNKTINWKPESTGTGRFGNWLENLVDWNLSRSRYWGTPLPIWRTEDGTEEICIGTIEELRKEIDKAVAAGLMQANPLPLPKSLSNREGLSDLPLPKSLSNREGLLASSEGSAPLLPMEKGLGDEATLQTYVFTADKSAWKSLKAFGRENRKNSTEAEDIIWQAVRSNKLGYKMRRQHTIDQYIADFVCISLKLVIEVDGEYHNEAEQKEYDQLRTEFLNYHGFEVIRFTNNQVINDLGGVIAQIKKALANQALPLPKSLSDREVLLASSEGSAPLLPMEKGLGDEAAIEGFDLHRPYVDNIILVSASGKPMTRETDLIDVWFDSGAMPYAQVHHLCGENEQTSVPSKGAFPADFISEGVDQTRGWFFTLHAIATMVSDTVAFKNVVSTGLVLDKAGNKMSKRLGNAVDPFSTLKQYGADPTRWYMITNAQPWDNLRFNIDGVTEIRNKFFGTLTNTYNFFALYANLDAYQLNEADRVPYQNLPELDRWILSKLQSLIKEVDEAFTDYEPTKAGRAIQDFVCDHLSNWYVRLSRRRFWQGEMTENKHAAYETLQHCLVAVAQLMSPIAPFYADWLYRNMTNHNRSKALENNTPLRQESVHLTDFQPVITEWIDPELEASMEMAQRISSLVHSLRKAHKIKVRQPLSKVLIPILNEDIKRQIIHVTPLIESEVNIKSVEFLTDASGVLSKKVKPNFKALGPKFGKDMKAVAAGIQAMTSTDIKILEENNAFAIPESNINITLEDVEILTEDLPGFLTATENGLTVALDITLTETLKQEGIAREVVNRVQNLRKELGFDVTDKINIRLQNNDSALTEAVLAMKAYICQEVQALSLEITTETDGLVAVEIDDIELKIGVSKV